MTSWWVDFADRTSGCIEADSAEQAARIARDVVIGDPLRVRPLPYPAHPRLYVRRITTDRLGRCVAEEPALCKTPADCAGHTECPAYKNCDGTPIALKRSKR